LLETYFVQNFISFPKVPTKMEGPEQLSEIFDSEQDLHFQFLNKKYRKLRIVRKNSQNDRQSTYKCHDSQDTLLTH